MLRVTFIAAPLVARSGVYQSSRELVDEGRSQGLHWSLVLGVSRRARGIPSDDDPAWVTELTVEPSGIRGVRSLAKELANLDSVKKADVVISLIPQSDMALSLTRKRWVAYLRGLPWPADNEASLLRRSVWRLLERLALRRAEETWVTTSILQNQVDIRGSHVVPPGIRPLARTWAGEGDRNHVVWAARFDEDKNPMLFLEIMSGLPLQGTMYGVGPLEQELISAAPDNVEVGGWVPSDQLWNDALAYVGTSHREAFGRSAVEAAAAGIPVILSDTFGSASSLVLDDAMKNRLILDTAEPTKWRETLIALANDAQFRQSVSEHIHANAQRLNVTYSVGHIVARLDKIVLHQDKTR